MYINLFKIRRRSWTSWRSRRSSISLRSFHMVICFIFKNY